MKYVDSFLSAACLALLICGCGGDGKPPLAPVSGIVTLEGVPVSGATISFIPVGGGRVGTAQTDGTGRYVMSTFPGDEADGALIGEHKVAIMKVTGPGASKPAEANPPADDGSDGLAPPSGDFDNGGDNADSDEGLEYLVPARYMNPDSSNLTITVEEGGTESGDFKLTVQ